MIRWRRAAARVAFAAAGVAALSAVHGQTSCIGPRDCAEQFGDNVEPWRSGNVETWERALRLAEWNVTSDMCKQGGRIEKTRKAFRTAFASANDKDAPILEWFFWADDLRDRFGQRLNGLHWPGLGKRGGVRRATCSSSTGTRTAPSSG